MLDRKDLSLREELQGLFRRSPDVFPLDSIDQVVKEILPLLYSYKSLTESAKKRTDEDKRLKAELEPLVELAGGLLARLSGLPKDCRAILLSEWIPEYHGNRHMEDAAIELDHIVSLLNKLKYAASQGPTSHCRTKGQTGGHQKVEARRWLIRQLCETFKEWTGQDPTGTDGGPFYELCHVCLACIEAGKGEDGTHTKGIHHVVVDVVKECRDILQT